MTIPRRVELALLPFLFSCVTPVDQEGFREDSGCIIDVRPKPKLPGDQTLTDDHYVVIEFEELDPKNKKQGVVFTLPSSGTYAAYAGLYSGKQATALGKGDNTLTLEHKDKKIRFVLRDPSGQLLLEADNDQGPVSANGDPIKWPKAEKLPDMNNRKVVRIRIRAYGWETGFTIHAKDLLLEPRWMKTPKPWP